MALNIRQMTSDNVKALDFSYDTCRLRIQLQLHHLPSCIKILCHREMQNTAKPAIRTRKDSRSKHYAIDILLCCDADLEFKTFPATQ